VLNINISDTSLETFYKNNDFSMSYKDTAQTIFPGNWSFVAICMAYELDEK
jgi:hypothetical protein